MSLCVPALHLALEFLVNSCEASVLRAARPEELTTHTLQGSEYLRVTQDAVVEGISSLPKRDQRRPQRKEYLC